MLKLSVPQKLTLLLALLSTAPLVFLVFNKSAGAIRRQATMRVASCQQLALTCSLQLRQQDYKSIEILLDRFANDHLELESVRLVRFDGWTIHDTGDKSGSSVRNSSRIVTQSNIRVPIVRQNRRWGELQARYNTDLAQTQLKDVAKAFGLTMLLNIATFGLLLKRALSVSSSSNAVPKRVRNTLDTIAGGVVILDADDKIVMANEAFQSWCGRDEGNLTNATLRDFRFCCEHEFLPWETAKSDGVRQSGVTLYFKAAENKEHCFVVNATPIFDAKNRNVGTLVSFEDVTILEEQKQSLVKAMAELERSKEKIHQQNIRLQELASIDALTGMINRRSLFERLEIDWTAFLEQDTPVNCVMLDVDHFKKLNDNYGHAVGDQVLKDVSRTIQATVRQRGVVGRYGGEEFCAVLSGMDLKAAAGIAEEVRAAIATELKEPYAVTASLGVSGGELAPATFQAMLEQADQALYSAKHGGRNAVGIWSPELAAAEEQQNQAQLVIESTADQPISYHAVASLHAALAYRDADTALHSQRVAEMSVALGRGLMPVSQLYVLEIAAILHDIGKVGVPDAVLLKPGKLDNEEWKVMEAHARIGVEIVESSFNSQSLADIVRFHHYRFDGTGAPDGAPVGKDIPIGARIVCIADAFDAMVSNRVYRKGRAAEEAFKELRRCAGTQFDPELVERFIKMQIGWRPDSRFGQDAMDNKLAVAIGHLTERTMTAFETHDQATLVESLTRLSHAGGQFGMPAIEHLATQLSKAVVDSRTGDWDEALPVLQDLLDICLMVQRAHIREVAGRPEQVENCPQSSYFETARAWWKTAESDSTDQLAKVP